MIRDYTSSIWWNLLLLTIGPSLVGFAIKALAVPHGFVSGGVSGVGLLIYYLTGKLTPGSWLFLLSIPVFVYGWFGVSRRFFFYSLYGLLTVVLAMELTHIQLPIKDPMLAAIAAGGLIGAGSGIAFRTMGSTGGLDIVAVALNQRFNIRVGQVSFAFNGLLFLCALLFLDVDRMLYSLVVVFIYGHVTEYFLGMFNQRKFVIVISDKSDDIAKAILSKVNRGVTFLHGEGAFSGAPKKVLLTVVNNMQVKRLEETVYGIDPQAFTIFGNTMNVLGYRFSKRKKY
ncbi:MAG: YitT family protein [Proteobacteria bacterium]|nr:YitT family protein [Pseudomonadota bacterium]